MTYSSLTDGSIAPNAPRSHMASNALSEFLKKEYRISHCGYRPDTMNSL